MTTVTQWFMGSWKPVHIGAYEVVRKGVMSEFPSKTFLIWSGTSWRHTEHSSCGKFVRYRAEMDCFDKWRGLAQEPKS